MPTNIKKKTEGKFTILDVDKKTSDPVGEVLEMLESDKHSGQSYIIDFTGLKSSKLGDEDFMKLLTALPNGHRNQYAIAVPDNMIDKTTKLAQNYAHTELRQPYHIINKRNALMMANQRN